MSHEIIKCRKCDGAIVQCRCPGPHSVRYVEGDAGHACGQKKADLAVLQDNVVEMAKDLLMLDTGALLAYEETRSHWTPKEQAFQNMIVAFHACRGYAEEFRRAHVEERKVDVRSAMEMQLAERMAEIDAAERQADIAAKRAS